MVSRIVKLIFWFENHSKSTGLLAEPDTGLRRLSEFAVAANCDEQIPDRSPWGPVQHAMAICTDHCKVFDFQ
jgi:hypothetical protein